MDIAPLGDEEMAQLVNEDHHAQTETGLDQVQQSAGTEIEIQSGERQGHQEQRREVPLQPDAEGFWLGWGHTVCPLGCVDVIQRVTSCRARRSTAWRSAKVGRAL